MRLTNLAHGELMILSSYLTLTYLIVCGGNLLLASVMTVLPLIKGSSYFVSLLTLMMIYMVFAHMWNLMGGYAGLLSLGMQAFIGIGGYSLAVLSTKYGVNIYISIIIGGFISMLFGLVVSPALFKMTGVYFAIGSWVVAEALLIAFSNWKYINYAKGITIKSVYRLSGEQIYYTAVILGVITTIIVFLIMRSKIGLALMAMRDNASAAEASGVKLFTTKLYITNQGSNLD